jgi:NAD(P)-dependent dehydrogenase (short-subunit alcohol dehydrogenase family)
MERILITGTNRGLGLGMVQHYLQREGTYVFATCRNPASAIELNRLAATNPRRMTIIPLDVSDEAAIDASAETVRQHTDGLDILINNAAINPRHVQTFENITPDLMRQVFQTNTLAPLLVVKAYLDLLKKGHNVRVVNISTQVGSMTWKQSGGSYAYATSKAALNMVTRCLAADLRAYGIITVMLHPGWVQTDMGGSSAPLTIAESVSSILRLIDGLTDKHNGGFFKWNGEVHPW